MQPADTLNNTEKAKQRPKIKRNLNKTKQGYTTESIAVSLYNFPFDAVDTGK